MKLSRMRLWKNSRHAAASSEATNIEATPSNVCYHFIVFDATGLNICFATR